MRHRAEADQVRLLVPARRSAAGRPACRRRSAAHRARPAAVDRRARPPSTGARPPAARLRSRGRGFRGGAVWTGADGRRAASPESTNEAQRPRSPRRPGRWTMSSAVMVCETFLSARVQSRRRVPRSAGSPGRPRGGAHGPPCEPEVLRNTGPGRGRYRGVFRPDVRADRRSPVPRPAALQSERSNSNPDERKDRPYAEDTSNCRPRRPDPGSGAGAGAEGQLRLQTRRRTSPAFKTYALKDGTKVGQQLIDDRIVAAIDAAAGGEGLHQGRRQPRRGRRLPRGLRQAEGHLDLQLRLRRRLRPVRLGLGRRLGRRHDHARRCATS